MFLPSKNKRKKQYSCRYWAFLRTEIVSRDFKNENLTTKIRRNKEQKKYFFNKIFQKIFKSTKPSNKTSILKNIRQRNKSNKIAKHCWSSRYKRSKSNQINYMSVPPKNKTKK